MEGSNFRLWARVFLAFLQFQRSPARSFMTHQLYRPRHPALSSSPASRHLAHSPAGELFCKAASRITFLYERSPYNRAENTCTMESRSCTNSCSGESVSPLTITRSVPCRWQKGGKALEAEADQ